MFKVELTNKVIHIDKNKYSCFYDFYLFILRNKKFPDNFTFTEKKQIIYLIMFKECEIKPQNNIIKFYKQIK